jgi:hypothetical protein
MGKRNRGSVSAKNFIALFLLSATLASSTVAQAGPWTPAPGGGYLKVWGRWLLGMGYSDAKGDTRKVGEYHEVGLFAYAEVGLAEAFAITVHAPIWQAFLLEEMKPGGGGSGLTLHMPLGDPTLGYRLRLYQKGGFALALSNTLRIPLASDKAVQAVVDTDSGQSFGSLRLGSGTWDLSFALSTGYAWKKAFIAISAEYVIRGAGYDHDLRWSLGGGYTFLGRIGLRLRLAGKHPLPTGSLSPDDNPSGIGNQTNYTAFGLEVDYRFWKAWTLGLGLEGGLVAVRRQSRGPVISLSVATNF